MLTAIGHPKLEKICDNCRTTVEEWAAEGVEEVNNGRAKITADAIHQIAAYKNANDDSFADADPD